MANAIESRARTGPSQRTAAERAAIDAHAKAHPRPLSGHQVAALLQMAGDRIWRTRAGWGFADGATFWSTPTVTALVKRGLARIHARRFALITAAGRREAGRHR